MPKTRKTGTIKQKLAFKNMIRAIETGEDVSMGKIMVKSGYSKNTAIAPHFNLISRKSFQELLATIDDNVILQRFYDILTDEDKRASIAAGVELLKLKDRYPANKLKVSQYEGELGAL